MSASADRQERVFRPPCGPVVGVVDGAVVRSRAIPYAQADRFAVPHAIEPWSVPHRSDEPAPACPQVPSELLDDLLGGPGTKLPTDEKCQRLTVTTPTEPGAAALPVMVWIHGGAYVLGAGDEPHHEPAPLVIEQGVIIVAVTFRLGVLGFLGDGSDARPANLGLLDLMLALGWVRDNIAAFGGDPRQVTVAGQSAGGDAVAHLMAVPEAARCFRRAIVQSAPLGIRKHRRAMAHHMFARTRHFDSRSSITDILGVQQRLIAAGIRHGLVGGMPFGVQYGFAPLPPQHEVERAWETSAADIDLLIGHTRDEMAMFVPAFPAAERMSRVPVLGRPVTTAVTDTLTHVIYSEPATRLARRHVRAGGSAVEYRLHWNAPDSGLGATHCIDLPLLFGVEEQWTRAGILAGASWPQVAAAGREMRAVWGRFIRGEDLGEREPDSAAGVLTYWAVRRGDSGGRAARNRAVSAN